MADSKISAMTSASALDGTELVPLVQGGVNVKATSQSIADLAGAGGISFATASGTDTYTAAITGVTSYTDGDAYLIRFTNGNTAAAPTLNINGLGAKSLYRNNDGELIGGDIWAGGEMLCIYDSGLDSFKCIGTSPNSLFAYVTNGDSVTITKGQPVYAFSGTGDRMVVKLALNTSDATSAKTVGVVYSTSIAANQKGIIIIQGLLDGLSTLPTSTWSDGDTVYLGATAGSITKTKPTAPNHLVYIATVTTASAGSAGRMYVRIQNGYELDELHDVAALSPSNNDGLFFESATSLWKNKSIGTVLGYTPASAARNITVNGTTQDLSADRTYTVTDANLSTSDITTNNVSTTKHGFAPKAPNDAKKFLDGVGNYSNLFQSIVIACSDEVTPLTTGSAKITFRMPYAMTISEVRASLTTAQSAGSIFTVDINESGTSILSTKLTIDNTEKTSTTAATPPVISDSALADDAEITIDIDQVGTSGATGLKVTLIGTRV